MIEHFIDPLITKVLVFELRYYGILFALGVFTGYMILRHLFKKQGFQTEDADTLFIYLIIGIIIGIRLVHCFAYDPVYYLTHPLEILKIWEGGLASHGAALGALVAIWLYVRNKKKRDYTFYQIGDTLVIPFTIGSSFIRLGNFFNSEIVGRETDLPWGVLFAVKDHVCKGISPDYCQVYSLDYVFQVYRHPSQLYELLIGVSLFTVLYILFTTIRDRVKPGFFFWSGMFGYFTARFLVEYVKAYQAMEPGFIFTMGQMLSLPFALLALGMFIFTKQYELKPAAPKPEPAAKNE